MDITSSGTTMSTSSSSRHPTTMGNFKEWSQVTPQPLPWAQHPSFYSPVMTFGSQQFYQPPSTMSSTTQSTVFQNAFMPTPTSTSLSSSTSQSSISSPGLYSSPSFKSATLHCKRKSELNPGTPVKQLITEERMAAHMSKLHISSETPIIPAATTSSSTAKEINPLDEPPADRERRLIMCEEMRRLQTESIIPTALMRQLERPCMAVMLWQPPQRTSSGIPLPSLNTTTSVITSMIENNNDTVVNRNNSRTVANNNISTIEEEDGDEISDMDMDL